MSENSTFGPKLIKAMISVGKYFQRSYFSLSDAEREIVVNLINAKWLTAYSNHEHEKIGENAGLPPEKVQALIAGVHTSFDEPRQQIVYDITRMLIAPRVAPRDLYERASLYERAIEFLGDRGLADLTVLIGYLTSVSLSLAAYDAPSNAVGLKR